jgi:fatty acid desaturase
MLRSVSRSASGDVVTPQSGARATDAAGHAGDAAPSSSRAEGARLYRLLRQELEAAGCFEAPRGRALGAMLAVATVYAAGYACLLGDPDWPLRLLACVVVTLAAVQAGLIAHEAGHRPITRRRRLATLFHMTLLGGVADAFFQDTHRRHHPVVNDPARDPDMQSALFSLCPESVRSKGRIGRRITAAQGYLVWLFVNLQAFSLKLDGVCLLLRRLRSTRTDQLVFGLHLVLWFGAPTVAIGFWETLLNYAVWTWLGGPYLAAIFYVNHVGTAVVGDDERTSFLQRQLATSRNVGTGRLSNVLFGGLNHHIEHHLFPAIPTCKLRVARPITRAFCRRHGLPYRETSWPCAVREVLHHLHAMAALARLPEPAVATA